MEQGRVRQETGEGDEALNAMLRNLELILYLMGNNLKECTHKGFNL